MEHVGQFQPSPQQIRAAAYGQQAFVCPEEWAHKEWAGMLPRSHHRTIPVLPYCLCPAPSLVLATDMSDFPAGPEQQVTVLSEKPRCRMGSGWVQCPVRTSGSRVPTRGRPHLSLHTELC